jgi:hypothetical protein
MARNEGSAQSAEALDDDLDLESSGDELHELEDSRDANDPNIGDTDADDAFDAGMLDAIGDLVNQDEADDELEDEDEKAIGDLLGADAGDDDDLDKEIAKELEAEQPRNKDGTFAEKAKADAKAVEQQNAKPGEPAATAAAAGDAKPEQKGEGEAPKWEPFKLTVDKQEHALENVGISRANGFVYLGVPEKDFQRFQQRIGRGIQFEGKWRQIEEGIREIEARKAAPTPPTDEQIEAKVILDTLKPYLPDILDEDGLAALADKVKLAQYESKQEFDKSEATRLAEAMKEPEPSWEERQYQLLVQTVFGIRDAHPELKDLTNDELKEIYSQELAPVAGALITKDGDQIFGNTEYIHARLMARAKASASRSVAPGSNAAPSPAAPANTADAGKRADRAERLNRGFDSAPRTTNLKAGRTAARSSAKENTREVRAATGQRTNRSPRQEQQLAEDRQRQSTRRFLRSNSFDFSDEGDEDDVEE